MTHLTRRSAIGLAMAALPLAAACADPMTDIDTDKDQVFRVADTDKDKLLDKNEYMALVEKRFKAADTDHDGKIDATELKTPAGQSLQKTSLLSRARRARG
jgi:hypothetical protein